MVAKTRLIKTDTLTGPTVALLIGCYGGVALTEHSARSSPGHEFQALNDKAISRQVVLAWARSWR